VGELEVVRTADLLGATVERLRQLLDEAFGGAFSDDDWDHALGGFHVLVGEQGRPVAHAAVVPRVMEIGDREFSSGYVEAVATLPRLQGTGHGSRAMERVNEIVRGEFEVGVLSTERHRFYERSGWQRWRGPAYVVRRAGRVRTQDEDEGIMVLRHGPSSDVVLTDPIACRERPGDDW
jgi:aminoglycoside 2'-N-acetyltransferase I